ncbi:MAG TPA: chemotaxis protein CheB [Xanthomonadaceae bacterium]|nr:chemotaxis protein CheB [Xanthomonadaceae bacterium]
MAEAGDGRRVVLLSRPGEAQDRLQAALREVGADLVLTADPTSFADARALEALHPDAVMVALDPAVEDALQRFDGVLGNPGVMVLFEEADLVAKRHGWDAARWVRHLHAKLHGLDDVLPAGRAGDTDVPSPDFEPLASGAMPEAPNVAAGDIGRFGTTSVAFDPVAAEALDAGGLDFEPIASGAMPEAPNVARGQSGSAPAAGLDEFLREQNAQAEEGTHAHAAQAEDPAQVDAPDFSDLQLEDETIATRPRKSGRAAPAAATKDLADLEQRISGLRLEGVESPARPQQGAVLVLAGIGGPDAVRQLLAGLALDFPRPVLVLQQLDGGRHDKLVGQMARATSMPVQLAEPGSEAQPGQVYILPQSIVLDTSAGSIRFVAGDSVPQDLIAGLPAADSAVLMLSGGDPAAVDAAMAGAGHGALVAGQSPEGCYAAEAANQLVARGAASGSPADLAHRLTQRWPS